MGFDGQKAALGVTHKACTWEVEYLLMDTFPEHGQREAFFRWSSLFICIFFFGTRSNEILFSCDTLSHGALSHCNCIRSVVRTCTFICQISHLSRIWEGILAPAVSAPVLAALRLLVQVSGCWCARRLSERLDWKIFPSYLDCDLAFWYSAKLSLRSHISTLQLVFLHFISLGVWALLSVPVPCTCKQHALVYVAQYFLVKWLKQGLPAEGLVCVPSRTNFFLLLSSFRNSKRKTVVYCSFFCQCVASSFLLRARWVKSNRSGQLPRTRFRSRCFVLGHTDLNEDSEVKGEDFNYRLQASKYESWDFAFLAYAAGRWI